MSKTIPANYSPELFSELRDKFNYLEYKFNPNTTPFDEAFHNIIELRNKTLQFYAEHPNLIHPGSVADETIRMLRDQQNIEEDDFRISQSLKFAYQNLKNGYKVGTVYINNNPPIGPGEELNACDAILPWRRQYGEDTIFNKESAGKISENQKEVKSLLYRHKNIYKAAIGCGEENLLEINSKIIDSNGLAIPFTINSPTMCLANVAPHEISITSQLEESTSVSNNFGSRLVSCTFLTKDYILLTEEWLGKSCVRKPSMSPIPSSSKSSSISNSSSSQSHSPT